MRLLRGCEGIKTLKERIDVLQCHSLDDLIALCGPETASMDEVDPVTRMRNVRTKIAWVNDKWREIGAAAMREMAHGDAYDEVIRKLSSMGIFLEGAQSTAYGSDRSDRAGQNARRKAEAARAMRRGRAAEMTMAMRQSPHQHESRPSSLTPCRDTPIPPRSRTTCVESSSPFSNDSAVKMQSP